MTEDQNQSSEDSINRQLAAILTDLPRNLVGTDAWLGSDIERSSFRGKTFDVGEAIFDYQVPPEVEAQPASFAPAQNGYILIEGRVRVLCHHRQRLLPYSASLLGKGELFGADHLLYEAPLSYQAVASSPCQVVQVTRNVLTAWLNRYPDLRVRWHHQAKQRALQVFFKRFTPLRVVPSKTLTHLLLSHIQERRIQPGVSLQEAVRPYEGLFWLRSGRLELKGAGHGAVPLGSSWSSDQQDFAEGIARTSVRLLHLKTKWPDYRLFSTLVGQWELVGG